LNALIADLVAQPPTSSRATRSYIGIVVIAAVVVVSTVGRMQPHVTRVLHVALVQGNDKDRELTDAELDGRYLPKSHFDLAEHIADPVDLIVFPESSMDEDPRTDEFVHSSLVAFAHEHHAWVLANATVDAPPDGHEAENLDVLFDPAGGIEG